MDSGEGVISHLILYTGIGWLLLFLWKKQPLSLALAKRSAYLEAMFACDLCTGVWLYFFLALAMRINLLDWFYLPGLSEFLTGCGVSFLRWLMRLGWDAMFRTILISGSEE